MDAARDQWDGLLDDLAKVAEDIVFGDPRVDSPLLRAEGVRYLTRLLTTAAREEIENNDPAYPQLTSFVSIVQNWGLPAADCTYLRAPVHGDHEYRIFGSRGTAHVFDVEVWEGRLSDFANMHVVEGAHEFAVGAEGEIEIHLSQREKAGNWLRLPPGPAWICIRQYYYDWDTEQPARLDIERVGATYPPPAVRPGELIERLRQFRQFVADSGRSLAVAARQHYAADGASIPFPALALGGAREFDDQVGLRDQAFGQGYFRCEPDQAVILEVTPPVCRYWHFMLATHFWEGLDWHRRQCSLNGHQAHLDSDGVFRAVISVGDPGVPNWLDPGGRTSGLIAARYQGTESVPIPTLRTVPLAELRQHLPADTPVVTAAERDGSLRRRMHSLRRRLGDG